jgi:hypothetical protein
MQVRSYCCLVEVMNIGYMLECKFCHSSYFTWKFVVDANYYAVEFSVIVRILRLVISRCCVRDVAGWRAGRLPAAGTHWHTSTTNFFLQNQKIIYREN